MQAGDYSKWGCIDLDIQTCHLFGHNKVAPQRSHTQWLKNEKGGQRRLLHQVQC